MFEDELEEVLLALRNVRKRLNEQNPQDDREKLLSEKARLLSLIGLEPEPEPYILSPVPGPSSR